MRNRLRRVLRSVAAARESSPDLRVCRAPAVRHIDGEVDGIIVHVDPVGRELPLLVKGVPVNFYVPLDCDISVDDRRARMRLLQPNDHIHLSYSIEQGVSTARRITVQNADVTQYSASSKGLEMDRSH